MGIGTGKQNFSLQQLLAVHKKVLWEKKINLPFVSKQQNCGIGGQVKIMRYKKLCILGTASQIFIFTQAFTNLVSIKCANAKSTPVTCF